MAILVLSDKLALEDWSEIQIIDGQIWWVRKIEYERPLFSPGISYKSDIFVHFIIWESNIKDPVFKHSWMQDLFNSTDHNYSNVESIKQNIDAFLLRVGKLVAFW